MARKKSSRNNKVTFRKPGYLLIGVAIASFAILGVALKAINHAESDFTADPSIAVNSSSGKLCRSFNKPSCLYANSFLLNQLITGNPTGRTMAWNSNGERFCWNNICYYTGTLKFTAQDNKCAAAASSQDRYVYVEHCSDVNGVIWAIAYSNPGAHLMFINRYKTQVNGRLMWLSEPSNGSSFSAQPYGADGYYQKFDLN